MKKNIYQKLAICLVAAFVVSCKKGNYTCTCTLDSSGSAFYNQVYTNTTSNNALSQCTDDAKNKAPFGQTYHCAIAL